MRKAVFGVCAALCVGTLAQVAEAKDFKLIPSDQAANATGKVEVEHQGPNTALDVKVHGLLSPMAVHDPQTRAYVVWVQSLDQPGQPQNVGALKISQGEPGELKTLTPFRNFQVFVTPEQDPRTPTPGGPHLMSGVVGGYGK